MRKKIVTDPFEFHRMMDEEKEQDAAAAAAIEERSEATWVERTYEPWRKVGLLPKNAWRAKKRERAAKRRKRWMARNPDK